MVGTSGTWLDRCSLETARPLRSPASTCSPYSPTPEMPAATLPPEQRGQRLAAAGVGDVVDLLRVHVVGLGQQPGQDLVGAAGRAAGDRAGRAVLSFQAGDEVLERVVRRVARHHDDLRLADQPGHRGDVGELDRGVVGLHRADHHQAHHHQQRVVGLPAQLAEPDGAAGALDVEHLDVAGDAGGADHPLQQPGGGVPAAARAGRGHDPQPGQVTGLDDRARAARGRQHRGGQRPRQQRPPGQGHRAPSHRPSSRPWTLHRPGPARQGRSRPSG